MDQSSAEDPPQNILCVCVCVCVGGGGGGRGKLTQKTDFTRNTFHYNYAFFSTVLLMLRGYVDLESLT